MNRAERRFRKQKVYDRRAKLFLRLWLNDIPCTAEEVPVHLQNRYRLNKRYWRPAETYQELQKYSETMHLYKNTGTIWDHGYWAKYDRHRLNKQSRVNARNDLKAGIEEIYNRTNLK